MPNLEHLRSAHPEVRGHTAPDRRSYARERAPSRSSTMPPGCSSPHTSRTRAAPTSPVPGSWRRTRIAPGRGRPPSVRPPAGGRARRPRTGVPRRVPDRWADLPLRTDPAPLPGASNCCATWATGSSAGWRRRSWRGPTSCWHVSNAPCSC